MISATSSAISRTTYRPCQATQGSVPNMNRVDEVAQRVELQFRTRQRTHGRQFGSPFVIVKGIERTEATKHYK